MKLKHKLMIATSAVLMAAMVPVSALASVKVKIYGDRRVYGTETPFDTYIELKSTGYGLINNTATIKLTLKNGKFATDSDGNYLPVYITDSKGETDRDEITSKLSDGSLYGFGFMPADDNYVKVTLPEDMIDTITVDVEGMPCGTVLTVGDIPELNSGKLDLQADKTEIVLRISDKTRGPSRAAKQTEE